MNKELKMPGMRLGRIAARSEPKTLMFAHFLKTNDPPPTSVNFWKSRSAFPNGSWGNDRYGDCTMAKQVNMFMRFERIERRRTINVDPKEVVKKYLMMTDELYGGGDTGAYEEDALNRSRREETCLRDTQGHPLLIDAYTRVDPKDLNAVKWAIALSAGHGTAHCIELPVAFQNLMDKDWDIPDGQALTGDWIPNSWGGHSQWNTAYGPRGVLTAQTWDMNPTWISWDAWSAYVDEHHVVIDSADAWRKNKLITKHLDVDGIIDAVNAVSSKKIKRN